MNKCEDCKHKEVCKYREECERFDPEYGPADFIQWTCKYFQPELTVYYRDNCAKPLQEIYINRTDSTLAGIDENCKLV